MQQDEYVPASRWESRPNMGHSRIRTEFSAGTRTAVDKAHAKHSKLSKNITVPTTKKKLITTTTKSNTANKISTSVLFVNCYNLKVSK